METGTYSLQTLPFLTSEDAGKAEEPIEVFGVSLYRRSNAVEADDVTPIDGMIATVEQAVTMIVVIAAGLAEVPPVRAVIRVAHVVELG